jgi:pimeloyl-ACP methyl ester carboxylesterase
MQRLVQSFLLALILQTGVMPAPVHAADALPAVGTRAQVTFDRYSPLAATNEIVRRTHSPIGAARVFGYLHDQSQQLPEQSIDLANEHFEIYVPNGDPPAEGYGLLVFIPPWDEPKVPMQWREVLDRFHLIYVSADRSGNDFDMLFRRLPLALHEYENVAARYKLNPERIYVSGFSGGSRTAMRAALSYPDVFHGAILNSGSDPYGDSGISVPPADLFRLFQQRSRVVLVSGTLDLIIDARDAAMLDSTHRLCVEGVDTQPMHDVEHALMRGPMLQHAIEEIERDRSEAKARHADEFERCRAGIASEIAQGLQQVRALLAQGDKSGAGHALSKIDERFGGLAAPESVELAKQLLSK